jgi:hypothetical protein
MGVRWLLFFAAPKLVADTSVWVDDAGGYCKEMGGCVALTILEVETELCVIID